MEPISNNNGQSPIPPSGDDGKRDELIGANNVGMNFPDAMREVLNGKRVIRQSWIGAPEYPTFCELREGYLKVFLKGEWHQWIINDGDMSGIDWMTIPKESQPVQADK